MALKRQRLVQRRRAQGFSQERFAEAVGVDRTTVVRWECAESEPQPWNRPAMARALKVSLDELEALLLDVAEVRHELSTEGRTVHAGPWIDDLDGPEGTAGSGYILDVVRDLWDGMLGRRAFLAGTGATTASALWVGRLGGIAPSAPDLTEAIEANSALTAGYWRLEGVLGPGAVYTQAADHYRLLTTWLRQTRDEAAWRTIAGLVANAGILLGWLHFDLEQHNQASALYRQILDLADELDDVNLQAFITGRMSRTLSECSQYTEALVVANLAERIAGDQALPAVRSWLAVTRAYIHACLGDERASRSDLDAAATILSQADEEPRPTYILFYGEPYLYKWTGHTLLCLARRKVASPREGRAIIEQALTIWPASDLRESGEVLTAFASIRLAERAVDDAAGLALSAYDIAIRTGSPRILRYVVGLRQRMDLYRLTPAVRALDDRLLTGQ